MKRFQSGAVELSYLDEGAGPPILLIHGFASNKQVNWVDTGWVKLLVDSGYRTIAIDNRGHGESAKLYDKEQYSGPIMAQDAVNLLDHLNIPHAHVMGYSMGARITAFMLLNHENRLASAILAGMGHNMVRGVGGAGPIAKALEAPSIDDVGHDTARTFRAFAESTGGDLLALAACIRSARDKITPEALAQISTPTLVAVGTKDVIAGPPQPLADLIPGAKALEIPGREHMKAVGDKTYKQGVLEFLKEHPIIN